MRVEKISVIIIWGMCDLLCDLLCDLSCDVTAGYILCQWNLNNHKQLPQISNKLWNRNQPDYCQIALYKVFVPTKFVLIQNVFFSTAVNAVV